MPGFNKRGSNYDVKWHKGIGKKGEMNPNPVPDWVAPTDYEHFCGEKILKEAYETCWSSDMAGYFSGLFLTGARATEFLEIKLNDISYDEVNKMVWVRDIPVYKQDPIGKRTFNFLIEDPLANEFLEFVEYIRKHYGEKAYLTEMARQDRNEWLVKYDNEIKWYKKEVSDFDNQSVTRRITQYQANEKMKKKTEELEEQQKLRRGEKLTRRLYLDLYDLICEIQERPADSLPKGQQARKYRRGPWWPHRMRFERASFLVSDRGYETYDLMAYFGWIESATPANYVKAGGKELEKKNLDARLDIFRREQARLEMAESPPPKPAQSSDLPLTDGSPRYYDKKE